MNPTTTKGTTTLTVKAELVEPSKTVDLTAAMDESSPMTSRMDIKNDDDHEDVAMVDLTAIVDGSSPRTSHGMDANDDDHDDDVATLLRLDPAGIAIRASMDPNAKTLLPQVAEFAAQLMRYATLLLPTTTTTNASTPFTNTDTDETNDAPAGIVISPATKSENGDAEIMKEDHQEEIHEIIHACIQQGAPASPPAANTPCTNNPLPQGVTELGLRVEEDETTDACFLEEDSSTMDTCPEPTLKRPRVDKGKETSIQPVPNKPAATLPDEEDNAPHQQVGCHAVEDTHTQEIPLETPAGFNGTLNQSQLKRSVGLTRAVLNQHFVRLGLTSCFSMGVISKRGQNVSHLTLNHRWNDLPYNEHQMLKWWVGEGPSRVSLASPLDPARVSPQPIIPIFFAQTNKGGGGALCHYVGHYQCVHFETGQSVVFKSKPRQALLGFQLVRFDQPLADQLAAIAAKKEEDKMPAGNEYHQVVHQDPALPSWQPQVEPPMDNGNTFPPILVKEDPETSFHQEHHFQASAISRNGQYFNQYFNPEAELRI